MRDKNFSQTTSKLFKIGSNSRNFRSKSKTSMDFNRTALSAAGGRAQSVGKFSRQKRPSTNEFGGFGKIYCNPMFNS